MSDHIDRKEGSDLRAKICRLQAKQNYIGQLVKFELDKLLQSLHTNSESG